MKTISTASTPSQATERVFYRQFDLDEARRSPSCKESAIHQRQSLTALDRWYDSKPHPNAGGVLVLPTGAGKTFTAMRFACAQPLSNGSKVLWMAHSHLLLEQAFATLQQEIGKITEPRRSLAVRVISGSSSHDSPSAISSSDDVVLGTIQTISNALSGKCEELESFLTSAKGQLFVVIDEAHHAPAPSYRKLVSELRERFQQMYLLGLTATPTYSDESKRGWLKRIFPQNIIHQETAQHLMATGILARPIIEELPTHYTPTFDDAEYRGWVDSNQDLPDHIITELANNRDRNAQIAAHYALNRAKYGKTIIFVDRWYQCEMLSRLLGEHGVKAGSVYTHVDADISGLDASKHRGKDENAKVLNLFRKGEIDVLINVRMLTEGTDVPDIQSVFLTRKTTSQILLTQMVGRALRGPKFGGTTEAYIVSFIDDWKQRVNWATFDPFADENADAGTRHYGKRPPLNQISVELIRHLTEQMDSGINVNPGPYTTLLPIGWYRVDYDTQVSGTDDLEPVNELLLVMESELACYERFIKYLVAHCPKELEAEDLTLDAVIDLVIDWRTEFFDDPHGSFGTNLAARLFKLARHIAQTGTAPRFFTFEERDNHDLDAIAKAFIRQDLGRRAEDEALRKEYARDDRMWTTFYRGYDHFKSAYDGCVNFLLNAIDPTSGDVEVISVRPTARPVRPQLPPISLPVALLPSTSASQKWAECSNSTALVMSSRRLAAGHLPHTNHNRAANRHARVTGQAATSPVTKKEARAA